MHGLRTMTTSASNPTSQGLPDSSLSLAFSTLAPTAGSLIHNALLDVGMASSARGCFEAHLGTNVHVGILGRDMFLPGGISEFSSYRVSLTPITYPESEALSITAQTY